MRDNPVFVAFYTSGPYEREADGLRYSLDALGLEHDIRKVLSKGSWQRNTQMKAEVMAWFLHDYAGRRVVYTDVDAYVIHRPELFWTTKADFGAHVWCPGEMLSGTLYFRSSIRTLALVQKWVEVCREHPDYLPDGRPAWDQRCLLHAYEQNHAALNLSFLDLPHSYCWMIGLSQQQRSNTSPIILHKEDGGAWKGKPVWRRETKNWVTETPEGVVITGPEVL
jgi:hypothetical protein